MFSRTQNVLCNLIPTVTSARRQARLAIRSGNFLRAADRYGLAARRLVRSLDGIPNVDLFSGDPALCRMHDQLRVLQRCAGEALRVAFQEDRHVAGSVAVSLIEPVALDSFMTGAADYLSPDEQLLCYLHDPLVAPSPLSALAARIPYADAVGCGVRTLFGVRMLEARSAADDRDALDALKRRALDGDNNGAAFRALCRLARRGCTAADAVLSDLQRLAHEQRKVRERERARRSAEELERARALASMR